MKTTAETVTVTYTLPGRSCRSWFNAQPRSALREFSDSQTAIEFAVKANARLGADGRVYVRSNVFGVLVSLL